MPTAFSHTTDLVEITLEEGILILRLNRPAKKNALTLEMYRALAVALKQADADRRVRVILLCGSGGNFTTGNDLLDFLQNPPKDGSSPVLTFLDALTNLEKPLVAAVEGLAVGVGVTLLLHCDYVCAGASSRFQLPFVNLGLVPEAGSTLLLPQMLGHLRAAELLLFGEPFAAATAKEAGLVTTIVADDQVVDFATGRARQLVSQPAAALRQTKMLLKRHSRAALTKTVQVEAQIFMERLASPEAAEALQAFVERRPADFSRF